jgi:hypothetical protein
MFPDTFQTLVSGNRLKDQCYWLHFWRDSTYQDLEQAYTKTAKRFNYPIAAQARLDASLKGTNNDA